MCNRQAISRNFLYKVARIIGDVSVEWLEYGTGEMIQKNPAPKPIFSVEHDGEQLRHYLRKHSIRFTDLQRAMGLGALSSVVGPKGYTTRKFIRPSTKERIAHALNVPVSDIFPLTTPSDSPGNNSSNGMLTLAFWSGGQS